RLWQRRPLSLTGRARATKSSQASGQNETKRQKSSGSEGIRPFQGRGGFTMVIRGLAPTAIHVCPLRGRGLRGGRRSERGGWQHRQVCGCKASLARLFY